MDDWTDFPLFVWVPWWGPVKKGKPELRKTSVSSSNSTTKVRSKKRREFLYFENNAGVTVNKEGEKKDSAIIGPVAKERADLWPRTAPNAGSTTRLSSVFVKDSLEAFAQNKGTSSAWGHNSRVESGNHGPQGALGLGPPSLWTGGCAYCLASEGQESVGPKGTRRAR